MTAIPATEGPEAAQVGPPPPFDAELRSALDAMTAGERPAFTLENIPLIRQVPSSAGTARVRRAPTSEPASGSVRFMVPVHSPVTIFSR